MSVIAISETAGSLGTDIGRAVAAALGYEFADREIITKAADQFGESPVELLHFTEEKPSLWERLMAPEETYKAYIEAVILDMAAHDNIVIVGRGSTVVLRDVPYVLHVRVTAPEPLRAQRAGQQQGLAPEAAREYVRQSDRERAARLRFLHHVDWDDALLYDLVLSTARMSAERAVRLICEALQEPRFATTDAQRAAMRDRSIVAQTRASLLANPNVGAPRISVSCRDGHVTLGGSVNSAQQRTAAEDMVARLPGVTRVTNELAVMPLTRITTHGA